MHTIEVDRRWTVATFCLVLCLTGCQRSENRYLDRPVEAHELVGRWVLTAASSTDLKELGNPLSAASKYEIVLVQDGSCRFDSLTRALTRAGNPAIPVAVDCKWRLGSIGRQAVLIELLGHMPQQVYYYFGESAGHLVLWQHAADPDQWQYFEYRRVS